MTTRGWVVRAAAAIAVAIAVVALVRDRDDDAADANRAGGALPTAPAGRPVASSPAPASKPAEAPRRKLDAPGRQRLLAQLAAARARRHPAPTAPATGASGGGGPNPALPPPELDTSYVRAQVRELVPMIKECYESALADDPKLAGTLTVEFTIGGEPEVGGLVESSTVLTNESTITNAQMVECVRETMYGAEFVAPPDGGQVVVHYPFTFRSQ